MKNILPDRCSAFIACHHSRFMNVSWQNFLSILNGGEIMAFSWEVSTVRFWEQLSLMELLLSFYAFKPTALCSAAVLRCCSTAASLAIDKARPETCKKPQNLGGRWLHCVVMHLAGVSRITLMFRGETSWGGEQFLLLKLPLVQSCQVILIFNPCVILSLPLPDCFKFYPEEMKWQATHHFACPPAPTDPRPWPQDQMSIFQVDAAG